MLLPGGQNPIPVPGQVYRCQGGFAAPQTRDCRSPGHGLTRCLLQRHAGADPLARPEHGVCCLNCYPSKGTKQPTNDLQPMPPFGDFKTDSSQLPKQKGGVTPSFSCSAIRLPHDVSEYSWQSLPQYRATSRSRDLSDSCTGLPARWRR